MRKMGRYRIGCANWRYDQLWTMSNDYEEGNGRGTDPLRLLRAKALGLQSIGVIEK